MQNENTKHLKGTLQTGIYMSEQYLYPLIKSIVLLRRYRRTRSARVKINFFFSENKFKSWNSCQFKNALNCYNFLIHSKHAHCNLIYHFMLVPRSKGKRGIGICSSDRMLYCENIYERRNNIPLKLWQCICRNKGEKQTKNVSECSSVERP